MRGTSRYSQAGVDYTKLDRLKVRAQKSAQQTAQNIRDTEFKEDSSSRGESAYVLEHDTYYLALVQEGLGTKNLIADEVRSYSGKTHYDALAQDTVAMITNDLITVGARPLTVMQYLATGDSAWLNDEQRMKDLVRGWKKACDKVGATWGGGETPALKGIIEPTTIDLGGNAVGVIQPKSRLLSGAKIQVDDVMIGFASSGIHANGLSLARKIADELPQKYQTPLANGVTFGEELLKPTYLYSALLQDLFAADIELHYAVNITGHGWRKLMRSQRRLRYHVTFTPPVPKIFSFLQQHAQMSDQEMYATFNMGVGFVIYVAQKDAQEALKIANKHFKSWQLGVVEEAKKAGVFISPKKILFQDSDLQIRVKK